MRKKLLHFSKKVFTHELITGSFFVFVGTTAGSVANLILNLFLTRHFTPADYGIYAAVASLIGLFAVPTQSISSAIIRFASTYLQQKDLLQAKTLFAHATKVIVILGFLVMLFFTLLSGVIAKFFQLSNPLYVVIAGVTIALGYFAIVTNGFLQSLLKFKFLSFLSASSSIVRLILGIILLIAGFHVTGVLLAGVIGSLVLLILSFLPLRFLFSTPSAKTVTIHVRDILIYGFFTSIALVSLSSFLSTDLILVKHFFSPEDAGSYAVLSLIGKIVFYITSPIATVVFPLLINRYEKGEAVYRLLFLACGLVLLPSLFLVVLYSMYPQVIIHLLTGKQSYISVSPYLSWYGLYIAFYSMVNVLVLFFLAIRKTVISYLVGFAAVSQIIGITLLHQNFAEVITVGVSVIGLLCIFLLLFSLKTRKQLIA